MACLLSFKVELSEFVLSRVVFFQIFDLLFAKKIISGLK